MSALRSPVSISADSARYPNSCPSLLPLGMQHVATLQRPLVIRATAPSAQHPHAEPTHQMRNTLNPRASSALKTPFSPQTRTHFLTKRSQTRPPLCATGATPSKQLPFAPNSPPPSGGRLRGCIWPTALTSRVASIIRVGLRVFASSCLIRPPKTLTTLRCSPACPR